MIKHIEKKDIIYIIFFIFFIIQPFLDTYFLYTNDIINIFKFSPATIIRFGCIGLFILYIIFTNNKDKKYIFGIIIVSLLYIILHHINMLNFNYVGNETLSYSAFQDFFYICRLLIPIFIIIIVFNLKVSFADASFIIQVASFIIGAEIVVTNLFKIGLASYTNKIIDGSIISWFTGAYNTYSFYNLASKGWFNFANQISALIIIFLPFNFNALFKKTTFFNASILFFATLSCLMLGTKVALYGFILVFIIMLGLYFFDSLAHKTFTSINKSSLIICFACIIIYGLIYPYSPAKNRQSLNEEIIANNTQGNLDNSLDNSDNVDFEVINQLLQNVSHSNDYNEKINFIKEYYPYYRIADDFIENSYPYKNDPDFWLTIMNLPIQKRIDYRYIEKAIIERVSEINNNSSSIYWGISYSRIQKIFNIERDFVLQYYALGIIGVILFLIIPFILYPVLFGLHILKDKNVAIDNCVLLLSIAIFIFAGLFSGNVMDCLTITIYIGLILGVMFSSNQSIIKKTINQSTKARKRISIIALHLGYGGVENSISSIANMLCKNYDVEIISTYKLYDKPAFYLNPKVQIKYLITDIKPNKESFKNALKQRNLFSIIKEGLVSIKILYLRKYKLIKELKELQTDVIISTRYLHNKWVGKYANANTIKIAQEHNHHNNNKRYIHKLIKSIKNFDYLLPVSRELANFYSIKLKNRKIKVIYIPHALDNIPNRISDLESNNILSIGRLSPEKGFDDLIDVFAEVCHTNDSARLKIIGDGPERETLEAKIKRVNLTDKIELCGFKTKPEIESYMLNSSLYVMTSYTESFGLVLVEAESYGLPLLAFNSAQGANEIITDGENGYLIENRDINKMSSKISNLLNNKYLRCQLGSVGRQNSMNYSQEIICNLWINFLENM